jgi:hypothetical protein
MQKQKQRVRFEEITPANTVVAFFEAQLKPLAAWLQIPVFDGYDDLGEMQVTFLILPSGQTIECFQYALQIYTQQNFPEYWAMLQRNLRLAYFDRVQGNQRENLERLIECFHGSLLVYQQGIHPDIWKINQEDLAKSQKSLELLKTQNLITSNR